METNLAPYEAIQDLILQLLWLFPDHITPLALNAFGCQLEIQPFGVFQSVLLLSNLFCIYSTGLMDS